MEIGMVSKRSLKALRRIRDREKLSMAILCTTLGVLRELRAPFIHPQDFDGVIRWYDGLPMAEQRKLMDDAFGVTALRKMQGAK